MAKGNKLGKVLSGLAAVVFLSAVAVYSNGGLIEQVKSGNDVGKINWEAGVIKCEGNGAPPSNMAPGQAKLMARRAAIVDCYRMLGETINGVQVSSETLVKNFVTESDVIKTKMDALIKGAQIVSEKSNADGTYTVIMQIPIFGQENSVSDVILTEEIEQEKQECGCYEPYPPAPPEPEVGTYTGLIVDASGIGAEPAMSPKVYGENGNEVYGTMKIDPEVAIEKGIVGYADNMTRAKNSWRAGDKPLIVKAKTKSGPMKSDITISNAEAEKVKAANDKAGFLPNLRVVIIL